MLWLILFNTCILWTSRYWHRSLNPRKLIEVKFSHLSRHMTMQRTLKLYKLPEVCIVVLNVVGENNDKCYGFFINLQLIRLFVNLQSLVYTL